MSSEENKKQTNHGVINQGKAQHDFPTNMSPMISVIANKYSWRFETLAAYDQVTIKTYVMTTFKLREE